MRKRFLQSNGHLKEMFFTNYKRRERKKKGFQMKNNKTQALGSSQAMYFFRASMSHDFVTYLPI